MSYHLDAFPAADADAVNRVALAAYDEYRDHFEDWAGFSQRIGAVAALAATGEILVARVDGQIVGAAVYLGPEAEKAAHFEPDWPVLRMLVVDPAFRGRGIGAALTDACIARAEDDGARLIALHASPIMERAEAMFHRRGFTLERQAEPVHGVAFGIYLKRW